MLGELKVRSGIGGSAGETDILNTTAEKLVVDIEDLTNVTGVVTASTIAGTAAMQVEYTLDGTHWIALGAAVAHGDIAATTSGVARTLSDANGMPILAKQIRCNATAIAGGGVYGFHAGGVKRAGF